MAQSLNQRRAELRDLNQAILERKKYLRDQEALLAEIIERGNGELMMLTHEIAIAKKQLRELKTDIRTSAQDKVILMQSITMLQLQVAV